MNLDFPLPVQKSAMFEKRNERIEAKYLIFRQINRKVLSDQTQHFSLGPLDRATLNLTTIKA